MRLALVALLAALATGCTGETSRPPYEVDERVRQERRKMETEETAQWRAARSSNR